MPFSILTGTSSPLSSTTLALYVFCLYSAKLLLISLECLSPQLLFQMMKHVSTILPYWVKYQAPQNISPKNSLNQDGSGLGKPMKHPYLAIPNRDIISHHIFQKVVNIPNRFRVPRKKNFEQDHCSQAFGEGKHKAPLTLQNWPWEGLFVNCGSHIWSVAKKMIGKDTGPNI